MINPSEIKKYSQKFADQNLRFRTFLKMNADIEDLDTQFLELHNELFTGYDCCQCANCCKSYGTF